MFPRPALSVLVCLFAVSATSAQTPKSPPPGYTLHANARAVLTDVTVTDQQGNPVHGLTQADFHIFDGKHEQTIVSFNEHTGAPVADVDAFPLAPHTFSNSVLLHPPPAFDVIVLDTTAMEIVDQMYLYQRLQHFINTLPPGQLIAIFANAGENLVPLQNFTADHALLLAAVHQGIPKLQQPGQDQYNELQGLHQLTEYLAQYPGRKNVLWFNGGSNLFLEADANAVHIDPGTLRRLYDQLDSVRIAIYPIDVRGPMVGAGWQHIQMEQEAAATGGHAYFNTNGLARVAAKIIQTGSDFYTITYSPLNFRPDTKWHKVKVKVDGGAYSLSYRSGYYDDGRNGPPDLNDAKPRTKLQANGDTAHLPSNRSQPIIFQVAARPATDFTTSVMPTPISATAAGVSAPKHNQAPYTFRYTVPAADFSSNKIATGKQVRIGVGLLVLNHYGRVVARKSQEFTLTINGNKLDANPNAVLSFDQHIDLPKGEQHVLVAVWHMQTGRLGTIEVPVTVSPQSKVLH